MTTGVALAALALGSAVGMWPAAARAGVVDTGEQRRRRRAARRWGDPERECLGVLDALVAALVAGAPAPTAMVLACEPFAQGGTRTGEGWSALRDCVERDGDVAQVWRDLAVAWSCPALADVAAAWSMSARHGCPLAEAMEGAAAGLRARRSHRAAVDAAVAGARATMGVLLLLPVLGGALAVLLGVDLFAIYSGPSGLVTLWPGLLALWCGHRWAERMTAGALREPDGAPPAPPHVAGGGAGW